jgi:hypothetical protein
MYCVYCIDELKKDFIKFVFKEELTHRDLLQAHEKRLFICLPIYFTSRDNVYIIYLI